MIKRILAGIKTPRFWVPALVFACFYSVYFWATIFHGNTLFGGPGDHTAGVMWLYDQNPHTPWWQSTGNTGYPWGDALWSPLFVMGQIGYILFWLCAKIAGGSVGGYNLFTFVGFALSFFIAYRFILQRLSVKPLLASLFALVITFTPMAFYLDGVGHSSYLFMPAYLIGALWLTLKMFETKSYRYAVCLGLLLGATVLFDPYFVLFIPLAVVTFAAVLLIGKYYKQTDMTLRQLLVRFAAVVGAGLIVATPVAIYLKSQSQEVGATTANTRSSMLFDATIYSAKLNDYVLPPAQNPLVPEAIKTVKQASYHGGDPTFTLYLGVVLMVATVAAVCWWFVHPPRASDRRMRMVGIGFLATAVVAFLFSLPPIIHVAGVEIYMPTWFLVTFTPAWRVFARLYFVVQPMLVLVVAIWFSEYVCRSLTAKGRKIKWSLAVLALALLLVEYMPRNPFDAAKFWTYEKNLPAMYQEIKALPDAAVLAEYPIREQPYYRGSLYFAGQHIHNKTLFNSYSPISPQANVRMSLMDLSSPQTIPALRQLGVTTLSVWNNGYQKNWEPTKADNLTLLSMEKFAGQTLRLYRINNDGPTRRFVGVINQVYRPDDRQIYGINQPLINGTQLEVVDLCQDTPRQLADCDTAVNQNPLRFNATLTNDSDKPQTLTVKDAQGKTVTSVEAPKGKSELQFPAQVGLYTVEFDSAIDNQLLLQDSEIQ